jgi:hypothetical protein
MANIINQYGQVKLGVRIPPLVSPLWNSIFGVWNADTLGTSLDTNIFRVYNGDNVNDTSGNAQNGTNVGGVTFTTGKVGNAFTFNGSNYVTLPNNSLNSLTGDFSISCWVNMSSIGGAQVFLSTYQAIGGVEYGFWFRVINGFQFSVYNGPTRIDTNPSGGAISTNTWYHVVITKTSSQIKWYINGVADNVFNGTYNIPYHPTSNVAAIGALHKWNGTDTVQYMSNGSKLDGLTVWNKVLTATEVASLYNTGTGAEYPFSSQTLPSPNDAVSTNHGTLMNGCTFAAGKIGKAFTFDGINDYVALPDNSLNLTGAFSYSFWIKASNTTDYTIIVGNVQNPRGSYSHVHGYQYWLSAGKLQTGYNNGVGISVGQTTTATIANGAWNHVVATYNPNNATTGSKVYINGTLDSQTTSLGLVNPIGYSSPMKACIGARNFNGSTLTFLSNGTSIDALSAWNKELTASEITELYNSGNGKQYPN